MVRFDNGLTNAGGVKVNPSTPDLKEWGTLRVDRGWHLLTPSLKAAREPAQGRVGATERVNI
jgi:hypothetical protein